MRDLELRLLQVLLWFASLSHVVIGAGIMLSPEFQQTIASVYGAKPDWTPQLVYILRTLGAFMFVWGILIAIAALNPPRHRLIIYGLCGVLLIRVAQRVLLQETIQEAFNISSARNLAMAGLFLLEAVAIAALTYRVGEKSAAGPSL